MYVPVLPSECTESAEQPHNCTDDKAGDECQQPTDNDGIDVSTPSRAGAEIVGKKTTDIPSQRTFSSHKDRGNQGKEQKKNAKKVQSNNASSVTHRPASWGIMPPKQKLNWPLRNKKGDF